MTDRWICARCYTSTEAAERTCPNCGATKGMSATFHTADAPPPAPRESSPEPPAPDTAAAPPPGATTEAAAAAGTSPAVSSAGAEPGGERWVCLRCFASNDGAAAACATCGLERGAEPPSDTPGQLPATGAPADTGSGGRQFPWRMVIFGVIALVVVGSTLFFAARRGDGGEITGAGDLSVQDLRVGDCFDLTDGDTTDGGEVSDVRAIPCAEPHVYEIYVVAEYPSGELPSAVDEPYTAWEEDQCIGGFDSYVGIGFSESIYYFSTLTPTDESWAQGDRAISCFLHNSGETVVSGSAQGSAQ